MNQPDPEVNDRIEEYRDPLNDPSRNFNEEQNEYVDGEDLEDSEKEPWNE